MEIKHVLACPYLCQYLCISISGIQDKMLNSIVSTFL